MEKQGNYHNLEFVFNIPFNVKSDIGYKSCIIKMEWYVDNTLLSENQKYLVV